MDRYTTVTFDLSRQLTMAYSTSFGLASRLIDRDLQQYIYAIYGLVRVADEIVDSYRGDDMTDKLNALELEVQLAIKDGFSTNQIVHAFAHTARKFEITSNLIAPFFESMRMDVKPPKHYDDALYHTYIHGSAEVVGLMCLRVFCDGDNQIYHELSSGARALGSAFQKVNFLRDLSADWQELSRYYFPIGSYESFDTEVKDAVVADIYVDFEKARCALVQLPSSSRRAVALAFNLYAVLLRKLDGNTADHVRTERIRVSDWHKAVILMKTYAGFIDKVN